MDRRTSIKRQLAARVAETAGLDPARAELILNGLYEETLRMAHEEKGWRIRGVGGMHRRESQRGRRCPRTGRDLAAHWAYWFRPFKPLIGRTAEICAARRG